MTIEEAAKHDDVVNAVQELRPEGLTQLIHDGLLRPLEGLLRVGIVVLLGGEAQLGPGGGQRLGADVAGHDDDGVQKLGML